MNAFFLLRASRPAAALAASCPPTSARLHVASSPPRELSHAASPPRFFHVVLSPLRHLCHLDHHLDLPNQSSGPSTFAIMVVFPRLLCAFVGGKDRQGKQGRQQDPRTDNRGADKKVEDEEEVMPRDRFRAIVDRRYREELGLGWSVSSLRTTQVPTDTDCRVNNLLCNSDANGCTRPNQMRE